MYVLAIHQCKFSRACVTVHAYIYIYIYIYTVITYMYLHVYGNLHMHIPRSSLMLSAIYTYHHHAYNVYIHVCNHMLRTSSICSAIYTYHYHVIYMCECVYKYTYIHTYAVYRIRAAARQQSARALHARSLSLMLLLHSLHDAIPAHELRGQLPLTKGSPRNLQPKCRLQQPAGYVGTPNRTKRRESGQKTTSIVCGKVLQAR